MPAIDPTAPKNVQQLEDNLSEPTPEVIQALAALPGDILILGVGGKMGLTLARMARRASDAAGVQRRVIGVSRFSDPGVEQRLQEQGVDTIACDLLDAPAVDRLPDAENVVYMTGLKFGTSANPALAWAMNCYAPALVSQRYRRSRIAVFSSGNVYGLVSGDSGGSIETDEPHPIGEYAMTVLGRERMFEYFSRELQIPMVLLRLNYATELRYGVLVDLAGKVWRGETIDISMGYANVVWQSEANALALASLAHTATPPLVLNIAGPEILDLADVSRQFGGLMNKPVRLTGQPAADAFLSNAGRCDALIGRPRVTAEQMIRWTADWVARGGESLGKPTHFESRDGKY